jgi:hypothetical protein
MIDPLTGQRISNTTVGTTVQSSPTSGVFSGFNAQGVPILSGNPYNAQNIVANPALPQVDDLGNMVQEISALSSLSDPKLAQAQIKGIASRFQNQTAQGTEYISGLPKSEGLLLGQNRQFARDRALEQQALSSAADATLEAVNANYAAEIRKQQLKEQETAKKEASKLRKDELRMKYASLTGKIAPKGMSYDDLVSAVGVSSYKASRASSSSSGSGSTNTYSTNAIYKGTDGNEIAIGIVKDRKTNAPIGVTDAFGNPLNYSLDPSRVRIGTSFTKDGSSSNEEDTPPVYGVVE